MDSTPPPAAPGSPPAPPAWPRSSTGLDPTVAAGLGVLFHWLGGLILFLVEKDSPYVKFYALQSLALDALYIACCVLAFILHVTADIIHLPLTFATGSGAFGIVWFILWIILLVNAFQGKVFELPVVGKWCRTQKRL